MLLLLQTTLGVYPPRAAKLVVMGCPSGAYFRKPPAAAAAAAVLLVLLLCCCCCWYLAAAVAAVGEGMRGGVGFYGSSINSKCSSSTSSSSSSNSRETVYIVVFVPWQPLASNCIWRRISCDPGLEDAGPSK